jgi:hypothetical protein
VSEILDDKVDKLEAMFGHLGNLSPDELRARVRAVRADRRIGKTKNSTKKKAKVSSDTAKTRLKSLVAKIGNDDLLEQMLKELEGDGED